MQGHLIHLMCGSTGAGKSTYSRRLSERIGGVIFSIDQWMATLFWMDTPKPLQVTWSMERVERCLAQIWTVASQVAARGTPCILDIGFGTGRSRERIHRLADEAGLSVQLHVLDVPVEERWRRVEARNAEKGASYDLPFAITREMFDFVETTWEPPTDREMADYNGIRVLP
jgi:predicted kinase